MKKLIALDETPADTRPPAATIRTGATIPGDAAQAVEKGLGGWLVFVGLGLFLSIPLQLAAISETVGVFDQSTWASLTTPGSNAFDPMWAPLSYFEIVSNAAFVLFEIVLIRSYFLKHKLFPQLAIIWLSSMAGFIVLDLLLAASIPAVAAQPYDPEDTRQVTRAIVGCAIWVPYFLRSRRVKATFVR